jgi:predicted Fe-Mo cluster-binding NifX family protein
MARARMKRIAISSTGPSVKAEVDRHFSCCAQFLLVDEGGVKVLVNRARGSGAKAGPDAARMLVNNGVTAVVTGNIGPKTFKVLKDAGVTVHAGCSGKIEEALFRCARNELKEVDSATFMGKLI